MSNFYAIYLGECNSGDSAGVPKTSIHMTAIFGMKASATGALGGSIKPDEAKAFWRMVPNSS